MVRCSTLAYDATSRDRYQCSRLGVLNEPDPQTQKRAWFCRQHAPSTIAKRNAARQAKWDAENKLSDLAEAVASAEREVIEYLMSDKFSTDGPHETAKEACRLRMDILAARQALAEAKQ